MESLRLDLQRSPATVSDRTSHFASVFTFATVSATINMSEARKRASSSPVASRAAPDRLPAFLVAHEAAALRRTSAHFGALRGALRQTPFGQQPPVQSCSVRVTAGVTGSSTPTPSYTPEQKAAAAVAEATAISEGLPLITHYSRRAQHAATRFKHVKNNQTCRARPFQVQVQGRSLGYFSTAQEAALAYSRRIGRIAALKEAAEARPAPMSLAEVTAAVEAEGLALVRSKHATGFLHVTHGPPRTGVPTYVLNRGRNLPCLSGKQRTFESGEEAALAVARMLGPASREQAAAYARESSRVHLCAEEARTAATMEGLTLIRAHNQSEFLSWVPVAVYSPYSAVLGYGLVFDWRAEGFYRRLVLQSSTEAFMLSSSSASSTSSPPRSG